MRHYAAILCLVGLAGCAARPPAISDIRSDVVKVQASTPAFYARPTQAAIDAEAQRGCQEYGNVVSHPLSSRCIAIDDFGGCRTTEYLYACKTR
jgi:hypothetical protein